MSFAIAAYVVILGTLGVYAWRLSARRRRLLAERAEHT